MGGMATHVLLGGKGIFLGVVPRGKTLAGTSLKHKRVFLEGLPGVWVSRILSGTLACHCSAPT